MNAAYSFWAPLVLGLKEAFNPYAVTTILFFLIFLSWAGKSKKEICWMGSFFILASAGTTLLLLFGVLENLFKYPVVFLFFRIVYLILAAVLLVLGMSHLRQWWHYRIRGNDCAFKQWPFSLEEQQSQNPQAKIFIKVIGSVILAFILTLLSSLWPQDYYLFLMFSYWVSRTDVLLAVSAFIWYSMGFVLPLCIVWLLILTILSSIQVRQMVKHVKGCLKIMTASLYFSMAISLIYLYFYK